MAEINISDEGATIEIDAPSFTVPDNLSIATLSTSGGIGAFGSTPPVSQPAAISDVPTGGSATAAANATAINAILAALRGAGTIDT